MSVIMTEIQVLQGMSLMLQLMISWDIENQSHMNLVMNACDPQMLVFDANR